MSSIMKIGELAKQTGLSIRTLHYYDEIGLLSPSHRTEIGHRVYRDQDIIRLQRILSLRQLGLSLQEIRDCIENPEFSLPQVIDLHRTQLREQVRISHQLLRRLDAIANELQTSQSVAIENLIEAMETITMTTQYFTAEQQAVLETRFHEGEADWQDLLTQVRTEMNAGTDFNSPTVRKLARRWLGSMKSFIHGDEQIYESLVRMYQQEGATAASWGAMDSTTFEYIMKAVSFLSLAEVTDLLIPTAKIFTPETKQIMQLGQDAIRQINFDIFGTEGILLGFLADGQSRVAQVLNAAGITFEAAEQLIKQVLGSHLQPDNTSLPPQLPYAPRAKYVIELAMNEAEQAGQTLIAPEHLMLAILQEAKTGGGVATHVITELGADLEKVEQQIRKGLG